MFPCVISHIHEMPVYGVYTQFVLAEIKIKMSIKKILWHGVRYYLEDVPQWQSAFLRRSVSYGFGPAIDTNWLPQCYWAQHRKEHRQLE